MRRLLILPALLAGCALARAETLTLYGSEDFPPFAYLADGQPTGFFPSLLRQLARRTGDDYRIVLLPWKRALHQAEAGEGGLLAFSKTADRLTRFDYSTLVYSNDVRLVVRRDRHVRFEGLQDLQGKLIGLHAGVTYGDAFSHEIEQGRLRVESDYSLNSRLRKLLGGRIDAALLTLTPGEFDKVLDADPELKRQRELLAVLPRPLLRDGMFIAFPKGLRRQAALQRLDRGLQALKDSGEFQQLLAQYRLVARASAAGAAPAIKSP